MKTQYTLAIIKPDGVGKRLIGEVISRYEKEGLEIAALRMVKLSKREAKGFYAVHSDKHFFDSLTDFMSSGPVVVAVLRGEDAIARNRKLMGATNPKEAQEGTIRRDFADGIEQNVVHGSDSPENATIEINYFFPGIQLVHTS
ncbi:MAG: nucleoside-diphosphate kinase [Bdellovibrionota bacterium]